MPTIPQFYPLNYFKTGEARKVLHIAIPLGLGYLGHIAIGTIDILMIGQLGATELAAAALTVNIFYTIFTLLAGIIMAVTPLASYALGKRQPRQARRVVRQGIWIAILLSLPGLMLLWHVNLLLLWTDVETALIAPATDYMRYFIWGMVPALMFDALRCFMVALGRTKSVTYITVAGIFINIFVNYCLIFGNFGFPALGLIGAGIASTIVNFAMFLFAFVIIINRPPFRKYQIFKNFFNADFITFKSILWLGLPIGGSIMLEQSMYTISTILAGRLGTIEAAAHSIAMVLINIVYMVSLGIGEAVTSRVGFNLGQRNSNGIQKAGYAGFIITALFMLCAISLVIPSREIIAAAFIDQNDIQAHHVISLAATLIIIGMLFEFIDAKQLILRGILNGLKDVKLPFYASIFSYLVGGASLAWYFSHHTDLGATGIWLGQMIGVFITALLLFGRYRYKMMRLRF